MTARLPKAFADQAGGGILPEWSAVDGFEITPGNDELSESTRALYLAAASTVRVTMAGASDTYTQATATLGASNARITATAVPDGVLGNNIRVAIAFSASATPGVTVTTATASGVTTITFTLRTSAAVTAEFLVLAFASGDANLRGTEADISLARSLVSLALTSGSDGSDDLAAVAATRLSGGVTTSPTLTFTNLQPGIHELAVRKVISATGTPGLIGLV